jgi:hypothetical protein
MNLARSLSGAAIARDVARAYASGRTEYDADLAMVRRKGCELGTGTEGSQCPIVLFPPEQALWIGIPRAECKQKIAINGVPETAAEPNVECRMSKEGSAGRVGQ